jgi:hypothetical protein
LASALRRNDYSLEPDEKIPLYIVPGRASLIEDEQAIIGELEAQLDGATPVLIVFDTLNKSLNGSENDENMARYHRAAGVIQDRFQCLVTSSITVATTRLARADTPHNKAPSIHRSLWRAPAILSP